MAVLLLFVVASVAGPAFHPPSWVEFFASVAAIVPLAAFIGSGTEALADRLGARVGGLFNATFGNAPDLLVGIFGVQKGLILLVKATIVGALISNSALIMGLCYIAAGLKYGRPRFNRHEAGHHSVLMMLTIAAILFPSLGSFVLCGTHGSCAGLSGAPILTISVGISIVLLMAYAAYLAFGVLGLESLRGKHVEPRESRFLAEDAAVQHRKPWPLWLAVTVLAAAALALIPVINNLTDSVAPVTKTLGLTEVFVGMVIIGNAGNAAELYAALRFALIRPGAPQGGGLQRDSGLDLALGIASASSVQIATFVAPVVVLISLLSRPMTLVFSPIEIGILALLTLMFTYTAQDGEANWLEGAQMLALYLMAAVVFFVLPTSAF